MSFDPADRTMYSGIARGRLLACVVNYRTYQLTRSCVSTLLLDEPRIQVVVADNSQDEGEWQALSGYFADDPRVTLIKTRSNIGYGAAVNLAFWAAEVTPLDVLFVFNPDTRLMGQQCIARLVNHLHAGYDLVGPAVVSGREKELRVWYSGATVDTARGWVDHWGWGESPAALTEESMVPCTFVTGAAMALTGKVWCELGGFREDLFLYWEDTDLCLRAREAGLVVGCARDVVVWHQVGASSGSERGKSSIYHYFYNRNRVVVCSQYASPLGILFGRGLPATAYFVWRALREDEFRVCKLSSAIRGLLGGFVASYRRSTHSGGA